MLTMPTVERCNSWKATGKLFYSLLSHAALSHPSMQPSQQRISQHFHHCATHSLGHLVAIYYQRSLQQIVPSSPFFFISSSPVFPSHSDLYYGISLCFVCFPVTPFISQSVWPHIIFKVDPNAFSGTCQHAFPVSLRHKSNIWKKTNKYKCK